MKRLFALLLVLVFALPGIAGAASADCLGLIEFVELFTQRAVEFQQTTGFDLKIMPSPYSPYKIKDTLIFPSNAGDIGVNPNDYTVHDVFVELVTPLDNKSNSHNLGRATVVFSTLEYDYTKDRILRLSKSSALSEAIDNFTVLITSEVLTKVAKAATHDGARQKLYSGNYDYFIEAFSGEDGIFIYLLAEQRP